MHRVRLGLGPLHGRRGAALQVVSHEFAAHAPQGLVNGRDLDKDLGAVALVLHHFLDPAHLPLYPLEAREFPSFSSLIDGNGLLFGFHIVAWKRRSRRLLVTTLTELMAIAA